MAPLRHTRAPPHCIPAQHLNEATLHYCHRFGHPLHPNPITHSPCYPWGLRSRHRLAHPLFGGSGVPPPPRSQGGVHRDVGPQRKTSISCSYEPKLGRHQMFRLPSSPTSPLQPTQPPLSPISPYPISNRPQLIHEPTACHSASFQIGTTATTINRSWTQQHRTTTTLNLHSANAACTGG